MLGNADASSGRLLGGLAHAHARGVLHRDLKPANVLLATDDAHPDGTRAVIADFGLAHARAREPSMPFVGAGTPCIMAPEQWRRAWRDEGPWTDLFAVGCIAWAVVTGGLPFGEEPRPGEWPLPAFAPRFAVPAGLEGWMRWLLEPAIRRRYASPIPALQSLRTLWHAD